MEISELKDILLNSGWFVDNEFFKKYINLIEANIKSPRVKYETQTHHAIPKCFYRQLEKEFNEKHDVNKENILVELKHGEHLLAHYYLALSVKDHLPITYLIDTALHIIYNTGDKCLLKNHSVILSEDFWKDFKDKLECFDELKIRYSKQCAFNSKKENMSPERLKKLAHTDEWKKKHSEQLKGRVNYIRTAEINYKISQTLKNGYREGKYKVSEESNQKKARKGSDNGMFGKHPIYIYKDDQIRRIFDVEQIPEGWSLQNPKNIRPVLQFDLDNNFVAEYLNPKEAAAALGLKGDEMIRRVCNGVYKQTKGYKFIWKNI